MSTTCSHKSILRGMTLATNAEQLQKLRETVDALKTALAETRKEMEALTKAVDQLELLKLRDRVTTAEAVVADLKKAKEESDKRQWQFVYIFSGAMATLVVTVIVQLVLALVKKP
jgi:phage terminase Nu1 subunit (DNA packaging protein)